MTTVVMLGQVAQGYMLTVLFDIWAVVLRQINLWGLPRNSFTFKTIKALSGCAIKFFACYVIWIQEKGRIVRMIFYEISGTNDSIPPYNLFNGRSELIEPEQPHSVYFLNKFV